MEFLLLLDNTQTARDAAIEKARSLIGKSNAVKLWRSWCIFEASKFFKNKFDREYYGKALLEARNATPKVWEDSLKEFQEAE